MLRPLTFPGESYRKARWLSRKHLEQDRAQLLRNFLQKQVRRYLCCSEAVHMQSLLSARWISSCAICGLVPLLAV